MAMSDGKNHDLFGFYLKFSTTTKFYCGFRHTFFT